MGKSYFIGIDTGGTFTDVVVLTESGEIFIAKASTTPTDFSAGVIDGLKAAAEGMNVSLHKLLSHCKIIKHGTTITTNALISRVGSKVGLLTTKGFEDTTLIMRAGGRVAGLSEEEIKHQATAVKPVPLVPRRLIKGITERVDFAGKVVISINMDEARKAIRTLIEDEKVDALAVNFLFGFVNPIHENAVKRLILEMYPRLDLLVVLASELIPVAREYARSNTVIINAYLDAPMRTYFEKLKAKLKENGYTGRLMIMQANGGIAQEEVVSAISTLESGPCGGMIASKYFADILGHSMVITSDMGGTSFDVGLLTDGFWHYQKAPIVERFHITWPMIDVESIGAGGGTIARVDGVTKELILGPQSAGADPGPVCYNRGGMEPTVTDANLVLGFLDPEYFLGGKIKLNKPEAVRAIKEKIAEPLGMDVVKAAAGIHDIINGRMADLIRKKVIQTGMMPEEHVVYSFGGASSIHAVGYASDLGIRKIYVFPTSAVFSAFGIAISDIVHTQVASYHSKMPVDPEGLNETLAEMEKKLIGILEMEGVPTDNVEFRRTFHMRFIRQVHELEVRVSTKKYKSRDIQDIMNYFEKRYEDTYGSGSAYPEAGIELISLNVDAVLKTMKPVIGSQKKMGRNPTKALKGSREVFFPGGIGKFMDTKIYDFGRLKSGNVLNGPSIVESETTTIVVPPGSRAEVDSYKNLAITVLERNSR